jgi:DNA polymerase IV
MLRARNWLIQTVTLKVRYSNFQLATRQRTFSRPIQSAADIAMAGYDLLDRTEATFRPVRLAGISVSGFIDVTQLDELPLYQEEIDLFGEHK